MIEIKQCVDCNKRYLMLVDNNSHPNCKIKCSCNWDTFYRNKFCPDCRLSHYIIVRGNAEYNSYVETKKKLIEDEQIQIFNLKY